MANVKVTELTALAAADSASTDVLPVVDVSADATKKLAISDLHRSVPDGTLSAPGIAFQSDLNSGMYRSGTDAIALVTNGAARILIDATGNVTIPNDLTVQGATTFITGQTVLIEDKNIELGVVSTPTDVTADGGGITLKGATDKTIQWINSTGAWTFNQPISVTVGSGTAKQTLGSSAVSGGSYTNYHGASGTKTWFVGSNYNVAGALEFWQSTTNGGTTPGSSPAMMIDSSGRLLVGTDSAPAGTDAQYAKFALRGNTINSNACYLSLGNGKSTANTTSDDNLGIITFNDNDSDAGEYARIVGASDGANGTNDYPGKLVFSTTADGGSSPTPRMTIDNSGNIFVNDPPGNSYTNGALISNAGLVASYVSSSTKVVTNEYTCTMVQLHRIQQTLMQMDLPRLLAIRLEFCQLVHSQR